MSRHSAKPAAATAADDEAAAYDPLSDRFLLEDEVAGITGLSRTTRWREERHGRFPKRRELSAGRIGWLASEVRAWMTARVAAPSVQGSTQAAARAEQPEAA